MTSVSLEDAGHRVSQTQVSISQVIDATLDEAVEDESARLAAEGYRFYADEAREFAEASARAVAESIALDQHDGGQPSLTVLPRRQ